MATQKRDDMCNALNSEQLTSLQKKTAIEGYLSYAIALSTAIQGSKVRLKQQIHYVWNSFMNGPKHSFSHPQINFGFPPPFLSSII